MNEGEDESLILFYLSKYILYIVQCTRENESQSRPIEGPNFFNKGNILFLSLLMQDQALEA